MKSIAKYARALQACRPLLSLTGIFLLSVLLISANSFADNPFSEILNSKDFQNAKVKRAQRSRLHYPLGPWFVKNSNFEMLFMESWFADYLIEWVAPVGKQYLLSDPRTDFPNTHVHAEALILERESRKKYQLAVLVPHPSFLTVIDGKLVEDFSVRQPPDLSVSSEEPITLQTFSGTFYRLTSDRCTVLVSMSHRTLVELRSIEPCENKSDIIKLGEALDLVRLDQRLQSQRDDSETR